MTEDAREGLPVWDEYEKARTEAQEHLAYLEKLLTVKQGLKSVEDHARNNISSRAVALGRADEELLARAEEAIQTLRQILATDAEEWDAFMTRMFSLDERWRW